MADQVVPTVKPYFSKTILINVAIALSGALAMLGILPGVHDWLQAHSDIAVSVLGFVGIGLRLITKGKISLE